MTAAEPVSELICHLPPRPYPGLRPFEKDEWPIFFGRERMVDEVITRLIHQRMVFVHGDSGCGKSSLVRAGVFARLEQNCAGEGWRTQSVLPRQSPLWNIAEALAQLAGEGGDEARILDWRRALNFGLGAPAAIGELLARSSSGPVCLLIDQFEELFQHAHLYGQEDAKLLTQILVALHESPPDNLYILMTMRSEYLGSCACYEGFAELVNAIQYLLPRMSRDDMLRAIRDPAATYDVQISRELADRLIADSGGGQDQLPLIQHGLMQIYTQRIAPGKGDMQLGIGDFPRAGGLAGLLSAHAQDIAASDRLSPKTGTPERLVEDVFRALTDINTDGKAVRRPQTLARLCEVTGVDIKVLRPVIDAFRADGVSFLSPYGNRPLAPDDLVDVSHEALIRCWRALAEPGHGWLFQEFRCGLIWRALLVQAESFERDPNNVLSPAATDEREAWMERRNSNWAERYGGGWERVQSLVAASVAARDRNRQVEAERLRQEGRTAEMLNGLFALKVLLVWLAGALIFGVVQYLIADGARTTSDYRISAERARDDAIKAKDEALLQRESAIALAASYEAEKKRVQQAQEELKTSAAVLGRVRSGLQQFSATASSKAAVTTKIDQARQDLASQADRLDNVVQQLSAPTSSVAPPTGPRVYVHIADPSQRDNAQVLEKALESSPLDGRKLVIPGGIQLVKVYPSKASLRCFDATECKTLAPRLLQEINRLLASPKVRLENLSDRYGGKASIRPGHYELWFPPGQITLSGM